jgi:hypothetical protein
MFQLLVFFNSRVSRGVITASIFGMILFSPTIAQSAPMSLVWAHNLPSDTCLNDADSDSSVIFLAGTNCGNPANTKIQARQTTNGTVMWEINWDLAPSNWDRASGVVSDGSSNVYVGTIWRSGTTDFARIYRLSRTTGNIIWALDLGMSGYLTRGLTIDGSGAIYAGFHAQSSGGTSYVRKYSPDRTLLWSSSFSSFSMWRVVHTGGDSVLAVGLRYNGGTSWTPQYYRLSASTGAILNGPVSLPTVGSSISDIMVATDGTNAFVMKNERNDPRVMSLTSAGSIRWSRSDRAWVTTQPSAPNAHMIVYETLRPWSTDDLGLYRINKDTGATLERFATDNNPLFGARRVFLSRDTNSLYYVSTGSPGMVMRISVPGATPTYSLTVNSSGASGVAITANNATYNGTTNYTRSGILSGTPITLTAPATASGNNFTSWTDCTSASGNNCTVSMNANLTVTANYVATPTYSLTVNSSGAAGVAITANNATYNGTTNYTRSGITSGTPITLTAPVTVGTNTFSSWTGCASASGNNCTVSMNANLTVTANYVATPTYSLTVNSSGAAVVAITANNATYNGTTNYTHSGIISGTSITLTAPATASGNNFTSWTGCASASGNNCTVSMTANRTVTATYAAPRLTITKTGVAALAGTVTGPGINCGLDCTEDYTVGTPVTLTGTITNGNVNFSGACTGTTCNLTMDANRSVTATFSCDTAGGYVWNTTLNSCALPPGVCGSADSQVFATAPSGGILCAVGAPIWDDNTGATDGTYNWRCDGTPEAICSAAREPVINIAATPDLIRRSQQAEVEVTITATWPVSCFLYNAVSTATPTAIPHDGTNSPNTTQVTTRQLSATQIVTLVCSYPPPFGGLPPLMTEERIEVIPSLQEI